MAIKQLSADVVGLPLFRAKPRRKAMVFDLGSHSRARDALAYALEMSEPGFNVFVLGPDRSGRMTETMSFLKASLAEKSERPDDWIYLNNFRRTHRPKPYCVPAGEGRRLRDALAEFVDNARDALTEAFRSEAHAQRIAALEADAQEAVNRAMSDVAAEAQKQGLVLLHSDQGTTIAAIGSDGSPVSLAELSPEEQEALEAPAQSVMNALGNVARLAAESRVKISQQAANVNRETGDAAISGLLLALAKDFGAHPGLQRWFTELGQDVLDNLALFVPPSARPDGAAPMQLPELRYAVNLLVDNGDADGVPLILEGAPSYDNLIGRIEYRPSGAHLETDFTLIRAGALHRANGGILVLRAEAMLREPGSWEALKAALRDGRIYIEERHRRNSLPISGAPNPKPIPLSVKVVLVGTPAMYYSAFSMDPDFNTHFKVKADIDDSMPASPRNVGLYKRLVVEKAERLRDQGIAEAAIDRLLGLATRWADDRRRLTARQELIDDVLAEAHAISIPGRPLEDQAVREAVLRRRHRNGRIEDRMLDRVLDGTVRVHFKGATVGQINGLTVRDMGDHSFGSPARVTARSSAGRQGVINIERDVAMGGPIQQKGAMVLQGYLAGRFAKRRPMAFDCSITFEQNYGGVEGDSATLAEVLAVLSDLADVPLRQDLAITGSMDQRGEAQAVGGVTQKVEGFFRACDETGLTGTQGAVLPRCNVPHLILDDKVKEAIDEGRFHVYAVDRLDDAAKLFTGLDAGTPNAKGVYPPDSLFGKVQARLIAFDRLLAERAGGLATD